jgi:SAM-dependent methyltransferase
MRLDMDILRSQLPPVLDGEPAPLIADLGCGTGRVAHQLPPLGYHMLNVDLSPAMLREVAAKTQPEYQSRSRCVCANLVQVDEALEPISVDMAVCLFSSLGMIRGRKHRRQFLSAVRQVLKPGGKLFVHVHNRLRSLFDPGGPSWLLRSRWQSLSSREWEFGDRVYAYRRLPNMFLHIYSRRELIADLRAAGFESLQIMPINATGDALLPQRTPLVGLRAGGYFAVASKHGVQKNNQHDA